MRHRSGKNSGDKSTMDARRQIWRRHSRKKL